MTVKEVADRYGVTGETLRYYERVVMLPPVTRTAGGIRDYTAEDLKWVGPMLCMRKAGLRRCCSSKRACTRCSLR